MLGGLGGRVVRPGTFDGSVRLRDHAGRISWPNPRQRRFRHHGVRDRRGTGCRVGRRAGHSRPGCGTPVHNGTEVFFTTTLGRIEPADARTTVWPGHGAAGRERSVRHGGRAGDFRRRHVDHRSRHRRRDGHADRRDRHSTDVADWRGHFEYRELGSKTSKATPCPRSSSVSRPRKGSVKPTSDLTNDQGDGHDCLSTTETATVTATSGGSATALTGTVVVIVPRTRSQARAESAYHSPYRLPSSAVSGAPLFTLMMPA